MLTLLFAREDQNLQNESFYPEFVTGQLSQFSRQVLDSDSHDKKLQYLWKGFSENMSK